MNKLVKYLLIAGLSVNSSEEGKIELKKDSGHTYSISYEKGLEQIKDICKNIQGEDSWIYSDNQWIDQGIGKNEKYKTSLDLKLSKEILENTKNKKRKVLHNHPSEISGNTYSHLPPSGTDLNTSLIHEKNGAKKGEIGVIDMNGVWTYYFKEDLNIEEKKDSLIFKYNKFNNNFIVSQLKPGFNFELEYGKLVNNCDSLGIHLDYVKK